MITEQEDTILIQNILNGNKVSEKTLYDKYKKRVINFIKQNYSCYNDIDDDVSEIMIRIFLNLKFFDVKKSKFNSWVFSIAKNYMIDKWRCKSCITTTTNYTIDSGMYTTSIDCIYNSGTIEFDNNTISVSNSFENSNSICYISTQISSQDYMLLDMKYIQGYDYDEIGKEFNLTSSTISNRVNYIKTKIKKNNSELIYE